MLSLPVNFELSKIPELKQFFMEFEENCSDIGSPKKEPTPLNNSIRKKLFDQFSEDSSAASTTTPVSSLAQPGRLPRPHIFSNEYDTQKSATQRNLASSSSSTTEDCLNRSFELDVSSYPTQD